MYSLRILLVASLALLGGIFAEVVEFTSCDTETKCSIHEVRVTPCKEAADKEPCKIKRGTMASISFDYTPEFEGTELTHSVYWEKNVDLPLANMNTDACHFTQCPVTKSKNQTLTYELKTSRKFPRGLFDLKWKLWNNANEECCFRFQIKLTA